jgi:hypothetical protein
MGAPSLDNFTTWLKHQIKPGNMVSPCLERAPTSLLMSAFSPESDSYFLDDLIPDKGQFRSRFHHALSDCCPVTIFRDILAALFGLSRLAVGHRRRRRNAVLTAASTARPYIRSAASMSEALKQRVIDFTEEVWHKDNCRR